MAAEEAPKRLTLEERLADAARRKGVNKAKSQQKVEINETDNDNSKSKGKDSSLVNSVLSDGEYEEKRFVVPADYKELEPDAIETIVNQYLSEQLKLCNNELHSLKSQLEESKARPTVKVTADRKVAELENKLQEKEMQVEELMNEGIALSKKELTLNQSIKRLKKHETELENELEESEGKTAKLQSKLDILENQVDSLKSLEKLFEEEKDSHKSLSRKYDVMVQANQSLTDELKEIKFSKLDVQLDAAKEQLKESRTLNDKLENDLQQLQHEFKEFKSSKLQLVTNLESENDKYRQQLSELSRESKLEIKRLEDKMEMLRFQNEYRTTSSKNSKESDMVQAQFDQAQENWKLIETSYLKKIQGYENEIDECRNSNITLTKKIKILTNDLKQKLLDNKLLQDNELTLRSTIDSLNAKLKDADNLNETLKLNLSDLKADYEKEKSSYETQIKAIQDENLQLEETLKLRSELNNSNSNNNGFYLQDLSSSSLSLNKTPYLTSSRKFNNSIGFGESSTTPRQVSATSFSRLNSINEIGTFISPQEKILAHQNSISSFDFLHDPMTPLGIQSNSFKNIDEEEDEDELELGAEAVINDDSELLSTINGNRSVNIGSTQNNSGNQHIQIIKKLSSTVSRLEMELLSSKDEINKLIGEREDTGSEMMKLLEQNKQFKKLENDLKEKGEEIGQLENKLNKALVLLGKKEERVCELNEDIEDLKDMLKQQVQQMVEMQDVIASK